MGYVEVIKVDRTEIDLCDNCNQEGLQSSGRYIQNSTGENIMWFCFNCIN